MRSTVDGRRMPRHTRRYAVLACALAALAIPASAHAVSVDLAVTQTDTPDPVKAGELLTYAIQVSNAGPDPAEDVRLVDTLDKRVAFAAVDHPSCKATSRRVICTLGTLAAGAVQNVNVQVRPESASRVYTAVNHLSIGKRKSDTQPPNNDSQVGTQVESPPPVICAGRTANVVGTAGNDTLVGTEGADVIALLGGNDEVVGLGGDDLVCGSGGDDTIRGGAGNDAARGGGGNDALKGGDGDDRLEGKGGDDQLAGLQGNDVLKGGGGSDSCRGGGGVNVKRSC